MAIFIFSDIFQKENLGTILPSVDPSNNKTPSRIFQDFKHFTESKFYHKCKYYLISMGAVFLIF